ncbi:MAG TPA: DedA family protein [Acidimicrobiales bacterium]
MVLATAGVAADTWWQYLLLFLAVAASWAGVPAIGATALTAAGVAASQGKLNLAVVVLVATAGGEVGGLIGYAVGDRWGRVLLDRPGKHQEGRRRIVEKGEVAYARWGRLAVFFTPAIVSGTAKMRHGQFVLWNLIASLAFSVSVAASAFGFGRLVTGNHTVHDIVTFIVGLAVGVLIMMWFVRHRRRSAAKRAPT